MNGRGQDWINYQFWLLEKAAKDRRRNADKPFMEDDTMHVFGGLPIEEFEPSDREAVDFDDAQDYFIMSDRNLNPPDDLEDDGDRFEDDGVEAEMVDDYTRSYGPHADYWREKERSA